MANGNGAALATPFPTQSIAARAVRLDPLFQRRAKRINQPIDSIDHHGPALFELGNARLRRLKLSLQAVALGLHGRKPLHRIGRRNRR